MILISVPRSCELPTYLYKSFTKLFLFQKCLSIEWFYGISSADNDRFVIACAFLFRYYKIGELRTSNSVATDAGGPLVANRQLIGVVASEMGCGHAQADGFTRVSNFVDWIRQVSQVVAV